MNNLCNKLISKQELDKIINNHLESCKISVNNIDLFLQAFMHKSFSYKDSFIDEEDNCSYFYLDNVSSNERLEFLGDSILNMSTAEYLFSLFPEKDEGFLTRVRTRLVKNTQLSHIGSKLGFKQWLLISNHVEKINGRDNPRLIEDVFESFIAALYKDQGFYVTREFIFKCFDNYVDLEFIISNNDNYKDSLLRYFQLNSWSHPVYNTFISDTLGKTKSFTTAVLLNTELVQDYEKIEKVSSRLSNEHSVNFKDSYILGVGVGKTKKESEQIASKHALENLNVSYNF